MRPVVKFVITNTHMGLGHEGLSDIIREHKKKNHLFAKVMKQEGGLILFLNNSMTAAKLYSEDGAVLGYLRMPGGRRLTAEAIDQIPRTFGGSVGYSSAVVSALKQFLVVESKRTSETELHAG